MRKAPAIGLVAVVWLVAATGAGAHEPEKVDRLEDRVDRLRTENVRLFQQREGLKLRLARARIRKDRLAERNADLQRERDQALAGLPDAIRAVPLDRFWPMVFTPAMEAWPCDRLSQFEDGRFILTFEHPDYCS